MPSALQLQLLLYLQFFSVSLSEEIQLSCDTVNLYYSVPLDKCDHAIIEFLQEGRTEMNLTKTYEITQLCLRKCLLQ